MMSSADQQLLFSNDAEIMFRMLGWASSERRDEGATLLCHGRFNVLYTLLSTLLRWTFVRSTQSLTICRATLRPMPQLGQ
jgi:hypothetical protein